MGRVPFPHNAETTAARRVFRPCLQNAAVGVRRKLDKRVLSSKQVVVHSILDNNMFECLDVPQLYMGKTNCSIHLPVYLC